MRAIVEVELIIWPRGAVSGKTQRPGPAGRVGRRTFSAGDGTADVRCGFWVVPCTGGGEPGSLWIGGRSPDLCGVAEKWENAIHLRPTCAGELRQCAFPALGNAALLVSAAASGAADEYLRPSSRTYIVALSRSRALFRSGEGSPAYLPSLFSGRYLPPPEKRLRSG